MENFKQRLDHELGEQRFDAAMQARVTAYIEQARPEATPRKDLRYVFTMVGAAALVLLLLIMSLTPSHIQPQTTAAIDDPVKSIYANLAEENSDFSVVTSDFDINTTHIRNAKKIADLQALLNATNEVKAVPKRAYHDVDLIVEYTHDKMRAFEFYSDDTGTYWFYDIDTKKAYEGQYGDDDTSIYDITMKNMSVFFIALLLIWGINWLVPRVMKRIYRRLGVEERPTKYVSNRHRYANIIGMAIMFITAIVIIFVVEQYQYVYILAFIYIPLMVDFYYEYRYGQMYRKYIESVLRVVIFSIVYFLFLYGQTYV
jgi:hypothetical protein